MKRSILLCLIAVALVGCIQYDEELWLNRDGSGRAKIRIIHRSSYPNTQEIIRKSQLPGIHLINYEVRKSEGNVIYNIYFKFDSIEAYNNVNDRVSNIDFWGKTTLNIDKDRTIRFQRRISLGSQEDEFLDDDILESIFHQHVTEDFRWTYKLHVPWRIVTANASTEDVDNAGKTITWSYDTDHIWNKSVTMSAEMRKDLPYLVFILAGLGVIIIAFSLYWLLSIKRKSHLMQWLHQRHKN
ncbi:MAG: hypothetical protein FJ042_00240 [Candidatus Cloacimonetes bacterium]|nr:hypothetical protein [Candidatus Cloacimonadota bacterium]